jgi:hypothetical protein
MLSVRLGEGAIYPCLDAPRCQQAEVGRGLAGELSISDLELPFPATVTSSQKCEYHSPVYHP